MDGRWIRSCVRISLLCAVLLTQACGGGDGQAGQNDGGTDIAPPGDGADGTPARSLSADVDALFGSLCQRYVACGTRGRFVSGVPGCKNMYASLYDCRAGLETAALDDLEICVASINALSCDLVWSVRFYGPECRKALASLERGAGFAFEGDACADRECGPYGYCSNSCGSDGVCLKDRQTALGESCPGNGPCVVGAACAFDDTGGGTCQALRPAGADCESNPICGSYYCNEQGKCAESQVGDACTGSCGNLLDCIAGRCTRSATVGEACSDELRCVADAQCVAGTCRALAACGTGAIGTPCVKNAQCAPGLACGGEDVCTQPATEGEPCVGQDCADGLLCILEDENVGVCVKDDSCAPSASQRPAGARAKRELSRPRAQRLLEPRRVMR